MKSVATSVTREGQAMLLINLALLAREGERQKEKQPAQQALSWLTRGEPAFVVIGSNTQVLEPEPRDPCR